MDRPVEVIKRTKKQQVEMLQARGVLESLNRARLILALKDRSLGEVLEAWKEANGK